MSLTIAQLVQRVGEDLSLVPIGQDLESQDAARIEATYNEVYQRILKAGYATWSSIADIPTAAVPYVALMVEEKLLTTYSVPESRYIRIKQDAGPDGDIALANLASATLNDYESVDDEVDF
jgi:hypothetical protein